MEITMSNWDAFKVATDGVPMVNDGSGKPLILRVFEYGIDPVKVKEIAEKKIVVNQQQIFNQHWAQIKSLIWSDGLVASTDVPPRVVMGKTRYRIFILCEPKFRVMVADRPKTLQEVFDKNKKK